MKIAVVPPYENYLEDELFQVKDGYDYVDKQGVDRVGFHELHRLAKDNGHEIGTVDKIGIESADACLFVDSNFGYLKQCLEMDSPPVLGYLMREPPSFAPFNGSAELVPLSSLFDVVFTWNDELTGISDTFVEYKWPQRLDTKFDGAKKFENKRLLTNISSRKHSPHPDELYSARKEVIKYYDANHPADFTLYGVGWNETPSLGDRIHYRKFGYTDLQTFQGPTSNKPEVYHSHRFALCFENQTGIDGWITEKIFDCLRTRVVPIYWGADNISSYVPQEAYIDYRELGTPEALDERLRSIDASEYREFLYAADSYIDGDVPQEFHPTHFAETILEELTSRTSTPKQLPGSLAETVRIQSELELLHGTKAYQHCGIPNEDVSDIERVLRAVKLAVTDPSLVVESPDLLYNPLKSFSS